MRTIHRIFLLISVWTLISAGLRAQNSSFSIVGGIPHLPVFANTDAVSSPKPGALIYSIADATVMIYSGAAWDWFCTDQMALTTGAYAQFTVDGGIPYLPVRSTASVTSTAGQAGTLYYPSDQAGLRINNSVNWFTFQALAAAPVTSNLTSIGNLSGLAGGVAIPVMAANPTFASTDVGAIYLNSSDYKLHVNNGTAWVAIDCSVCPPYADGAMVNVDLFTGEYSYYQKTGIAEGTSLYRWRVATDASGNGATLDPTTTIDYTPGYSDALDGKYLQFEVRPKITGFGPMGRAVTSPWTLISNCPPQAQGVTLGIPDKTFSTATQTLGVSYSYFDKEGNAEGTSDVKLFMASDALGTSAVQLASGAALSYSYTYTDADQGKYLYATVTPKAASGSITGSLASGALKVWNCPPQASGVLINGTLTVGQTLTAAYAYYDKEANAEGASAYQWYRATNAAGADKTAISGATSANYTLVAGDSGYYIGFGVTPNATAGYSTGNESVSYTATPIP